VAAVDAIVAGETIVAAPIVVVIEARTAAAIVVLTVAVTAAVEIAALAAEAAGQAADPVDDSNAGPVAVSVAIGVTRADVPARRAVHN